MNQQPQPQFPMMVHPFFGMPPAPMPPRNDVPPARVQMAMEYLAFLSVKQMKRAVANNMSIEIVPGQALDEEEVLAKHAACKTLAKYFSGRLPFSQWEDESQRLHVVSEMNLIPCPICRPRGTILPDCQTCHGIGAIQVPRS